jgi:hypothetical protein
MGGARRREREGREKGERRERERREKERFMRSPGVPAVYISAYVYWCLRVCQGYLTII